MTTGTAHSHFVSIPLSQMLTCPDAIGPAVSGPVSKPDGNFLSDPIVSFDGLHVIPTQSLVPQPFNSNACHDEFFCIKQPEVNQVTHLLDSLSYGYMMQRLTYRNFGPRQTLLLNHTVAATPTSEITAR